MGPLPGQPVWPAGPRPPVPPGGYPPGPAPYPGSVPGQAPYPGSAPGHPARPGQFGPGRPGDTGQFRTVGHPGAGDTGQFRAVGAPTGQFQAPAGPAQRLMTQAVPAPVMRPPGPHPFGAPPPPLRPMPVGAYPGQAPSGLFPARSPQAAAQPRPVLRELLPVTVGKGAIGVLAGTLWMGLFGLLASSARGYLWWTIVAAVLAWPVLAVLTRFGDRGVAAGAAVSTGFGLAIAGLVLAVHTFAGEWILW